MPHLGRVYCIVASKHIEAVTPLKVKWLKRRHGKESPQRRFNKLKLGAHPRFSHI